MFIDQEVMKVGLYTKPEFYVTKFRANEVIASGCSQEDTYNPVSVDCLKTGSHEIFYDNCDTDYNNCTIVEYDGDEYLVWDLHNGGGSSQGGEHNDRLFNKITQATGVGQMVHIGRITPDIDSVINHS